MREIIDVEARDLKNEACTSTCKTSLYVVTHGCSRSREGLELSQSRGHDNFHRLEFSPGKKGGEWSRIISKRLDEG